MQYGSQVNMAITFSQKYATGVPQAAFDRQTIFHAVRENPTRSLANGIKP